MKTSEKTNKHKEVLNYLKKHKRITSMEAIDKFGATRLASIIFNLRKRGFNISTIMVDTVDRYDNHCRYGIYQYDE